MKTERSKAEKESALFLSPSDRKAQEEDPRRDGPVEVKYDLTKHSNPGEGKLIFLAFCDHLLVATVVVVNVVGFWRGLFGIFLQFRDLYHLLFLYLLGSTIILHFTVARNAYKKHLKDYNIRGSVLRKGYTYVFGCACVAQWAGLWYFLDAMSGFEVHPPLTYSVVCTAILIGIKLFRNVLASPVTFCTDHLEGFFEFPTVFHANLTEEFLSVADAVLSALVIAPAVIAYWRGTWYLSDFYVFPQNLELNLIASAVVGTLVQVAFLLGQGPLQRTFHPGKHRILYYVASRLYTYLYGVACVNFWRGGWKALDLYSGTDIVQVVVPTAVSLLVLMSLKTTRNLSSAPLAVVLDSPTDYFRVPTMFKLTGTSDTSLYVLDCFFSVFVVGSLVVFVWRGVWCLIDVFLYPGNDKYSAFGSLAIGYGIVILVFSVQTPMEGLCEKLTGFWRLAVADIYIFISFMGTINLWRGIWNLLNIYFLPESPVLSCWITHLGSFAFLALINCSNSTLVRGVYLDGEEGGKCVAFPISYLRQIFQKHLHQREVEGRRRGGKGKPLGEASPDIEKGQKGNSENGKTCIPTGGSPQEVKS